MNAIPINVKRTDAELAPDPARVLLRPFIPGDVPRLERIVTGIMSISESDVGPLLTAVSSKFSKRHRQISQLFNERFRQLRELVSIDGELSEQRQLLIGSYFLSEFSVESAALFNPSMVADPDQQGLLPGALRFVMSLRATGDGSISSVVFRTGIIHADHRIEVMAATGYIVEPSRIPNALYEKPLFERKLLELGLTNEHTRRVMQRLRDWFTQQELQSTIETELKECSTPEGEKDRQDTAQRISMLAKSNCSVQFLPEQGLSERVIFPVTLSQRNGIEDARFVRFQNDDGTHVYFATFTAFDGQLGIPRLLETSDFLLFRFATLNGPAVQNKGMALFPKKINGLYAMLSRQDSENICLMFSDNIHFWYEPKILLKPVFPWEMVQIGNCGSPIETSAGWLVPSHGVGPVREYSIGAFLLDLDDPSKVIGRLREPLLKPILTEWEGNVPNVTYSCGALLHDGELFLPYGVSDYATRFATVELDEVLAAMQ
ncbi:MAG: Beta,4-mannooligosaccharide phosphorylase [Bryobacterales bacterium]|nr:Beta,4-mannooligosaccharide phosphorylase [Bryobacterales bacterium]